MDYDVKFVEYKGGNIKVSYTVTPLNSHEEASIISRIDKPHEDFMRAWHELVLMGAYSVAVLQGVTYMGLGSVNKEAGIDSKYFDPKRDEKAVKLAFDGYFDIQQCANVIYKLFGDSEKENYANNSRFGYPTYKINPRLEALYHWLVALGYQMSSEEKLLATGQHEVFQQIKGA